MLVASEYPFLPILSLNPPLTRSLPGVDLMVAPVVPVGGFDVLSSSFNKPLLAAIVIILSVGTSVVRVVLSNKQLNARWR